jgi:TldD protein
MQDYRNLLSDLMSRYRHRVDFLSIRLEKSEGSNIVIKNNQTENLSEGTSVGGQVRACYKGGWGFATFNDLTQLCSRIEDAISSALLIGDDETILAPIIPIQISCELPLMGTNPRLIPLVEKKRLCDRYDRILREADEKITSSRVSYYDSQQTILGWTAK